MNKDKVVVLQKPERAKYFRQSRGPMVTCSSNCRKISIAPDAVPCQNASRAEPEGDLQRSPIAAESARSHRSRK